MQNKKFFQFRYTHLAALLLLSCGNISLAADYKCVPAPSINPPPAIAGINLSNTLPAVCPAGQVPQPLITHEYRDKAPPPNDAQMFAPEYRYVFAYQFADNTGASAYFTQNKPYLSPADSHTLAEIAVQSQDRRQIVEIGWTVDRGLNGDDNPHLFVFSWVNGIPNCYNGCGYVQYSPNVRPGMSLVPDGSKHLMSIQYYAGNWWLSYDGQWMGFFPESLWKNKGTPYNRAGLAQWFGEATILSGNHTQMGNGIFGSASGSASINNTNIFLAGRFRHANWTISATNPGCYNFGVVAPGDTFRYGGPGC